MSATDYLEKKIMDHIVGQAPYTPPTTLWMALHTQDPGDVGSGYEVAGGSYAPQQVQFGATTSPGGVTANTNTPTFTAMPAGTVTHFSIRDASGGNPLFVDALSPPVNLVAGALLKFDPGTVTLTAS